MGSRAIKAEPLDRHAVEMLSGEFLIAIRAHYQRRPTTRATAQEILNALGSCAAIIIYGTGSPDSRAEARAFFDQAVNLQLDDLSEG